MSRRRSLRAHFQRKAILPFSRTEMRAGDAYGFIRKASVYHAAAHQHAFGHSGAGSVYAHIRALIILNRKGSADNLIQKIAPYYHIHLIHIDSRRLNAAFHSRFKHLALRLFKGILAPFAIGHNHIKALAQGPLPFFSAHNRISSRIINGLAKSECLFA